MPTTTTPPDLDTRPEIRALVIDFYREVQADDLLGPVFVDVARVDWSSHVPHLVDYWCLVLLGETGYAGTTLATHRRIHGLVGFRREHFERWLEIFEDCVDRRWTGEQSVRAKDHARRVIETLRRRLAVEALSVVEVGRG